MSEKRIFEDLKFTKIWLFMIVIMIIMCSLSYLDIFVFALMLIHLLSVIVLVYL